MEIRKFITAISLTLIFGVSPSIAQEKYSLNSYIGNLKEFKEKLSFNFEEQAPSSIKVADNPNKYLSDLQFIDEGSVFSQVAVNYEDNLRSLQGQKVITPEIGIGQRFFISSMEIQPSLRYGKAFLNSTGDSTTPRLIPFGEQYTLSAQMRLTKNTSLELNLTKYKRPDLDGNLSQVFLKSEF